MERSVEKNVGRGLISLTRAKRETSILVDIYIYIYIYIERERERERDRERDREFPCHI